MARQKCAACRREFVAAFDYQTAPSPDGRAGPWCSPGCVPQAEGTKTCTTCAKAFEVTLVWQADAGHFYCSEPCRPGAEKKRKGLVLAVVNQKGGTGKTTTAIHVAAGFAEAGERVLLIDADAQGNVGTSLDLKSPGTLFHLMIDGEPLDDLIVPARPNLDLLGADAGLAVIDLKLPSMKGRSGVLERQLERWRGHYDRVVIDCGPSLSLLNQNALCAATGVLIPVACEYLSLVGVRQVLRTLRNVESLLGHPVALVGVVPTMFDRRRRMDRQVLAALEERFGERVAAPIRQNSRITEAPSHGKTIFEYDRRSNGAFDYRALVTWLKTRDWKVNDGR